MSSRYCCPRTYRRRRRYYPRKTRPGLYAPKNPYNIKQEPSPVHVNDYNFTPDDAPQLREILERGGFLADLTDDEGPEYETKYITINSPGEKHYDDANYFHGKVTNDLYITPYMPGYFLLDNQSIETTLNGNIYTNTTSIPYDYTITTGSHYVMLFHFGSFTDHGVSQVTISTYTVTSDSTIKISGGDTIIDLRHIPDFGMNIDYCLLSEKPLIEGNRLVKTPADSKITVPPDTDTNYPVPAGQGILSYVLLSFPGPLYLIAYHFQDPIFIINRQHYLCWDPSIPQPPIP